MFFNTHTHINDLNIENVEELINNALKNNVNYLCVIGTNIADSIKAIELAHTYSNVYAVCGVHPSELKTFNDDFTLLENLYNDEKTVGIGEIGLDYHYLDSDKEIQLKYFEKFLIQATKYKKPVIIHCRDAYLDTYNLLEKYHKKLDGIIMHCYSGSKEMMERFLKLGCYISFSGVVTFKNAKSVKEVASFVPLDKLLIETDDPYLTPHPFRGQKNQPAYVYYVAEEIARIKNLSVEEIAQITTNNAKKVFHL